MDGCMTLFRIWNDDNIGKIAKLSPHPVIVRHLGHYPQDGIDDNTIVVVVWHEQSNICRAVKCVIGYKNAAKF